MANLGTIGVQGAFAYQNEDTAPRQTFNRGIVIAGRIAAPFIIGAKDSVVGNGSAPSFRMDAKGYFRLYWTVAAGVRTFYVYVKQAANLSPRPRVTIVANAAIGQAADVTSDASSSTGWVLIGPIFTSTLSAAGVLEVRLENRLDAQVGIAPCYWDDIVSA